MRYARSCGLAASWERTEDNCYIVTITGREQPTTATPETPQNKEGLSLQYLPQTDRPPETVVIISGTRYGQGDEQLGELLMRNFIFSLSQQDSPPDSIILINSGVKLSVNGSPVLEELGKLAKTGVKILSCGTCLDYYKLAGELAVGEITNMYDLVNTLTGAGKIISL